MNPAVLADEVDRRIAALDRPSTEPVRRVRREVSAEIRGEPGGDVVALAFALVGRHRWVAYELLYHHPAGMAALTLDDVEALGEGMAGWAAVDAFGRYVSGPAWQRRRIPDAAVRRWAVSSDRWWRRAALVSTVPLNLAAAGGNGDTPRTLDICGRLVDDRDDTVVKALSWALRALAVRDPGAVRAFLADHGDAVAARVRREVRAKLDTGRKNAGRHMAEKKSVS